MFHKIDNNSDFCYPRLPHSLEVPHPPLPQGWISGVWQVGLWKTDDWQCIDSAKKLLWAWEVQSGILGHKLWGWTRIALGSRARWQGKDGVLPLGIQKEEKIIYIYIYIYIYKLKDFPGCSLVKWGNRRGYWPFHCLFLDTLANYMWVVLYRLLSTVPKISLWFLPQACCC